MTVESEETLKLRRGARAAMNARVLLLASLLVLGGLVATAPSASAMCYLDPDEPVPGATCGARSVTSCALALVKKGTCAL